jgi:hypothetical protein
MGYVCKIYAKRFLFQLEALNSSVQSLKQEISEDLVPYEVRLKGTSELEEVAKSLKERARELLRYILLHF